MRSIILTFLITFYALTLSAANNTATGIQALDLIPTDIGGRSENNCVLRDQYGFLWVGSQSGLQCYDGNGTPLYRSDAPAMRPVSNLSVSALHRSGDDIWIGGEGGLYVFDRSANSISPFGYKTRYGVNISASVPKMLDVSPGLTWIITHGQGFFIFNSADKSLLQNSRHASYYSDMAIGANGLIYLASIDGYIQAFKPDGLFVGQWRLPDNISYKNRISVAASGRDIWISSGTALFRLDISAGTITAVNSGDGNGTINSLLARPDGSLLLGTNSGIKIYNTISGGEVAQVSAASKSGMPADVRVSAMFPEANGDIVIIHPTGPLETLTLKSPAYKFIQMPVSDSDLGYNLVRAVALSHDRSGLWIGSDRGLDYYDLRSGTFDKNRLTRIDNIPVTALSVQGHRLWIGTQNSGVYLYDTHSGDISRFSYSENTPNSIVSNEINHIFISKAGEVFILTNWGICRHDSAAGNFPQLKEFNQQIRGITMHEDSNGCLWIATSNGLFKRKPGDNRFHGERRLKSGESIVVTMLHRDNKGRLWAASQNNGVFMYNPEDDSFPDLDISLLNGKAVAFLSNDMSDGVWVGAEDMLLRLDDKKHVALFDFGHHNRWTPVPGVAEALDGGKTAIGCRNGFLIFDPNKLKSYDDKIKVYPLSLSFPFVDDDSRGLSDLGLDRLLYAGSQQAINLPYDLNTFTINLASSRPAALPDVRYDYCLEGVDKDWITGASVHKVTYNNLPPGNYRFLLRPYGISNAKVAALEISVLPPWYRTTWAYAVYAVLLLLAATLAGFGIRRSLRRKYHRQLNDMRIRNEREVFEAKSRYFVDLVHEIRTPLMLISLPLEQLADEINGGSTAEKGRTAPRYIKSMQRNIDYLLGITNQLLDFRRAENSSEIRLSFSRCDVRRMLADMCQRFDEPLKISGKEIELCLPDNPVMATIDKDKTERLLMNLIGNAMKYARHKITVTLRPDAESLIMTVADDGPGVPADERERIFDAYYQIGNDNVAASLGTGLGLAYAKLIANAHKGDINVSETPGGGALFTLTLPAGDSLAVAEEELDRESAGELPEPAADDKSKTILLVEDNDDLRSMITEALGRHYTVITAIDGMMALDILSANDIDVIVSDVMMPRMNGLELCRKVKSDFNSSHIPFIILTAKTGREAQAEGMECGADVYLEKPFPIRQLVYQIRNLLATRQLFYERMRKSAGEAVQAENSGNGSPAPVSETAGLNRLDAEFLTKMNTIISESIANEDLSIDLIAEKLNLSRSSFYRKITAVTGMSPSDYLKNFRLNHAASLLSDGCRVTEVAYRSGFTSSSYFAKCFREKFGVLPSDYVARSTRRAENGQ